MRRSVAFVISNVSFLLLGIGLGIHVSGERSSSSSRLASEKKSSAGAQSVVSGDALNFQSRQQSLRSVVARCDTDVLWKWLATASEENDEAFSVAIEELVDRLGWAAFEHSLGIGDDRLRSLLSDRMLGLFARKDPWKAFDVYKMHRTDFTDPRWGRLALDCCVFAAADLSADKMLEVFAEMPSKETEVFMIAAYRSDFDFKKVLDRLVSSSQQPGSVPENLISEWARRSPVDASAWLAGHPDFMNHEVLEYRGRLVLETIANWPVRAERGLALEDAGRLPDEFLTKAWSEIGGQQKGRVEPGFLDAADRMGRRGEFLSEVLLSTRNLEEIDPTWSSIPTEERMAVLKAAESKWADEVDTPLARRAREQWRAMILRAWKAAG